MRARFHGLAGAAGAIACGLAAAVYCAAAPPPFAAGAVVGVEADATIPAAYDETALRALALSDAVLHKAALAPEAAAAIAREARPGPFDAFLALLSGRASPTDTLGRAADLLARRIEVERGATPRSARIVVRMEDSAAAADAANAVARAIVAAHNDTAARIDRRLDMTRRENLARAERRRDEARERLVALRMIDPAPTASIARATPPRQDASAAAQAEAQRVATAAEQRRVDAARTYGPRHPEMIHLETEARRAAAALQAARARPLAAAGAPPRPPAEGGPDPRIAEFAEAQAAADRAEAAYEKEAVRYASPNREARLVEAARAPAGRETAPPALTVGVSALLGFALFAAAPALGARRPRPPTRRPHATLRGGELDAVGARRVVDALDIAAASRARRISVQGEDDRAARQGARALAMAALALGWRPLLICPPDAPGGTSAFVTLDGALYATGALRTRVGDLVVGRPARRPRKPPADADIAFDLVIFAAHPEPGRPDLSVWVGADAPDRRHARHAGFSDRDAFWLGLA